MFTETYLKQQSEKSNELTGAWPRGAEGAHPYLSDTFVQQKQTFSKTNNFLPYVEWFFLDSRNKSASERPEKGNLIKTVFFTFSAGLIIFFSIKRMKR